MSEKGVENTAEKVGPGNKKTPKRRGLFRSSMIYALGDLLTKGARIILIPYFIACLSQEEVGLLAILQAIIFATWTVLSLGFGHAVQRFYHQYGDDREAFTSTLWGSRLLMAVPVYVLLMLAGHLFATRIATTLPIHLVYLAITAGFFRSGLNITELWMVIREQPVSYRLFTFSQFMLTTLLTIYLISGRGWGVTGAMVAELSSYILFTLIAGFIHFRTALPRRALIKWRECSAYCLPVLPHALFMWGVSAIDRILLERYVDPSEIGVYHIGYLLASVVSIGALAMRSAWLPRFFQQKDREQGGKEFGRTATLFFYMVALGSLATFVFAPELVALFSMFGSSDYSRAADIIRIVVVGIAGFSVFMGFNQPLFYERRIGLLASISGFGLLVNIGLNLALLPAYGIYGAAVATVLAYWTFAGALLLILSRVYHVHWEIRHLLFIGGVAVVFGAIALGLPDGVGIGMAMGKTALLLGFIAVTLLKLSPSDSHGLRIGLRFSPRNRPKSS